MKKNVRVRFAPAPTGTMHLGNVRAALMNFLFAKKYDGTFVLRIEDTDPDRNFDPNGTQIMQDLQWMGLDFQEGPQVGGSFGPYQQSLRTDIYQAKLDELKSKDLVYYCFCTEAELAKKRERQRALKMPPRYDRTCYDLDKETIQKNVAAGKPFIFRFKVPDNTTIEINELSRGLMKFESNNFSDFPVTRSDSTFTFIFANVIDDMLMNITYVLRGEDHLSNTANQVMMYQAFGCESPTFWHLPIITNVDGKKLSKRDFGFALHDLMRGGFLPEAINNYLAIIGGSFKSEIMSMDELVNAYDFESVKTTGPIKYDVDKLKWVNHKWIDRYDPEKLAQLAKPLLHENYEAAKNLDDATITKLVQGIKSEMTTLNDVIPALNFYFENPILSKEVIFEHIPTVQHDSFKKLIRSSLESIEDTDVFVSALKMGAKEAGISNKVLFCSIRLALTGSSKGPSIHELVELLGASRSKERLEKIVA